MAPYNYIAEDDPSGKQRRQNSRTDRTPWGLLLVLLLSCTYALHSRQRSLIESETHDYHRDLMEKVEEESINTEPEYKQQFPFRSDAEIQAMAEATFDPKLHELYANLPELPMLRDYAANGGWRFSDAVYDYAANHPAADVLSWDKPRVIIFRSFLTPEEVGHIIRVAKENMARSHVLSDSEDEQVDDVRTSFGAWPPHDFIINAVVERLHRIVGIPFSFGEDIYVLNYQLGQKYDAHNDNCVDITDGKKAKDLKPDEGCLGFLKRAGGPACGPGGGGDSCGDRIATMIMHLSAPSRGGRTVFPTATISTERIQASGKEVDAGDTWYCDREEVLGVSPNPGDVTLFFDYKPAGGSGTGTYDNFTADPAALPVPEAMHSGCPVWEGEKWIATRWIRGSRFV